MPPKWEGAPLPISNILIHLGWSSLSRYASIDPQGDRHSDSRYSRQEFAVEPIFPSPVLPPGVNKDNSTSLSRHPRLEWERQIRRRHREPGPARLYWAYRQRVSRKPSPAVRPSQAHPRSTPHTGPIPASIAGKAPIVETYLAKSHSTRDSAQDMASSPARRRQSATARH